MNDSGRPDDDQLQSETRHRRTGNGMIWLAAIATLGLLTFWFDDVLKGQINPNRSVNSSVVNGSVAEVILTANRQDHYVANAQINGQDIMVLVDTGATTVAIGARTARDLDLEFGYATWVSTANGLSEAWATVLAEVRLGDIVMRDVPATIVPNLEDGEALLGMSFLADLEMTHRDDTLILRQKL